MDGQKINELGVVIEDLIADKPKAKAKCYNARLKIFREFVLATLSALAETKSKQVFTSNDNELPTQSQVYALDALSCAGIAGIQWKQHLSSRVHVTMAEHDDTKKITDNAQANSLTCTEMKLNPLRVPGDFFGQQGDKEVHFCQAEAKTVMMMEAFNFIYLSPIKNCAAYFEAALHSVTSDGVLCVVVPDVSLFARSPHVVQRFYAADIVKTEYLKELAARIVLANLARAASRCVKGISPQYVLSHEDCLLICVKVSRGHKSSDSSIHAVEKLLHCRLCEERTFLPNQLAPLDEPYSLLACSCKKNNPGKTAVILGPVWKGPLNEPDFLNNIHKQGKQLNLSNKFFELAHLLIKETVCSKSDSIRNVAASSDPQIVAVGNDSKDCGDFSTDSKACSSTSASSNTAEDKAELISAAVDMEDKSVDPEHIVQTPGATSLSLNAANEITNGRTHGQEDQQNETEPTSTQKRKAEDGQDSVGDDTKPKRQKKDKDGEMIKIASVPFYYNITKFKKTTLPKLDKLVTILHCCGHRASRTHFDSCAIRTSASVEEFLHIFVSVSVRTLIYKLLTSQGRQCCSLKC